MDNRLRERRQELNLSQVKVATLAQMPNSLVSDFELGKRKPWPKAKKILAQILGMPEEELFPSEGDQDGNG